MTKTTSMLLAFIIMAIVLVSPAYSDDSKTTRSYEDLLEVYTNRSELIPEASALEASLLAEGETLKPIELWISIKNLGLPAKIRAANGLVLVRNIFPGGNPGRWDEVSGFWLPRLVPIQLAAFDSVFYTSIALLQLDDEAAPWLAQELLEDLCGSSRASFLAMRTAPREYPELISRLQSSTGLTPVGGWPKAEISGTLPFGHPTSSYVTQDHAMMLGMVFMNASGQLVSGSGPFAWDRKKGRVYRVVEPRDDIEWWLIQ